MTDPSQKPAAAAGQDDEEKALAILLDAARSADAAGVHSRVLAIGLVLIGARILNDMEGPVKTATFLANIVTKLAAGARPTLAEILRTIPPAGTA